MTAVWLILRAEFRRRWRAWLALALLVALVGGLVLAAAAAGRRTASAFPRFYGLYGYDSYVYSYQPIPKLAALPEVSSVVDIEGAANGSPICTCSQLDQYDFSVNEVSPSAFPHYLKLVGGRLANQSSRYEALISFNVQQDTGLHVGSVIRVPLYSDSQNPVVDTVPHGPTVTFHVVGIVADETDFPSVGTPSYELFTTEAFDRSSLNPTKNLFSGYAVRLRHGSTDAATFDRQVLAMGALGFGGQETTSSVTSAIHPQAVGWWLLAALAALAGVATVAQALSRQATVEASTYRTLAAMGVEPRQLAILGIIRATAVGIAGAIGAVGLAYLLSPLSPVGEARIAEPSTGLYFDPLVLWLGALGTVIALFLLGIWPALRSARQSRSVDVNATARRPSPIVDRLAAAGTPPPVVTGARRALERGHGPDSVPVGTALVGCALAVAALCATTVFGASLSRLTVTPRFYGQAFQLWFNNLGTGPSSVDPVLSQLRTDRSVTAITLGTSGSVTINGVSADAIAGQSERGPLLVTSVQGRIPTAADEVALATRTMSHAHAHVGSSVRVSVAQPGGGTINSTYKVVGSTTFPPDFGAVGLNTGAIFSTAGYVDAQCPASGPGVSQCRETTAKQLSYVLLVGLRSGPAGHADAARYVRKFPQEALLPISPANLVNFGEAVNFPLILGIVLAVFGAATLLHVLVVSVARRRRELGLLKSLGFVRRQAAATAFWQAVTVAIVGLVVGVPIGIATGQVVWRAFAVNLGVVPDPTVPVLALIALAGAVLVGAVVLSVGPALVSARSAVAPLLRSE